MIYEIFIYIYIYQYSSLTCFKYIYINKNLKITNEKLTWRTKNPEKGRPHNNYEFVIRLHNKHIISIYIYMLKYQIRLYIYNILTPQNYNEIQV